MGLIGFGITGRHLRRGEDVLSGRRIRFDLCRGTLEATGRTRVQIHPKPKAEEKSP